MLLMTAGKSPEKTERCPFNRVKDYFSCELIFIIAGEPEDSFAFKWLHYSPTCWG